MSRQTAAPRARQEEVSQRTDIPSSLLDTGGVGSNSRHSVATSIAAHAASGDSVSATSNESGHDSAGNSATRSFRIRGANGAELNFTEEGLVQYISTNLRGEVEVFARKNNYPPDWRESTAAEIVKRLTENQALPDGSVNLTRAIVNNFGKQVFSDMQRGGDGFITREATPLDQIREGDAHRRSAESSFDWIIKGADPKLDRARVELQKTYESITDKDTRFPGTNVAEKRAYFINLFKQEDGKFPGQDRSVLTAADVEEKRALVQEKLEGLRSSQPSSRREDRDLTRDIERCESQIRSYTKQIVRINQSDSLIDKGHANGIAYRQKQVIGKLVDQGLIPFDVTPQDYQRSTSQNFSDPRVSSRAVESRMRAEAAEMRAERGKPSGERDDASQARSAMVPARADHTSLNSPPAAPHTQQSMQPARRSYSTQTSATITPAHPVGEAPAVGQIDHTRTAIEERIASEGQAIASSYESRMITTPKQFAATQTQQRLKNVEQESTNVQFHKSQFIKGDHNVTHEVTFPPGETDKNIRVDFVDPSGKEKSFIYRPNKFPHFSEGAAHTAARQGIEIDSTPYPGGYTAATKVTFTQPGTYRVNGVQVKVPVTSEGVSGSKDEAPLTPENAPYQQFRIAPNHSGEMPKQLWVSLNNTNGSYVDLESLQKGESITMGNSGVEVCRLDSGEIRLKCYKPGRLDLISKYAGDRQSPSSHSIRADPSMQAYYSVQDELSRAGKIVSPEERFNQLQDTLKKVRELEQSLGEPYKGNLNKAFKQAFVKMWSDAAEKMQPEDFIKRLDSYQLLAQRDVGLYSLTAEDISRLKNAAARRGTPSALSNPFAVTDS